MRIALRTSGGRGEYELAGHQAAIRASDLLDKELEFQISPDVVLLGHQAAHHVQGKPRIRLEDQSNSRHAYLLLAAVLMLPKPKRELKATSTSSDFVRDNQYAVAGIDVDVVNRTGTSVLLRPTTLWLENASNLAQAVGVAERMALVQTIWAEARETVSDIAGLVQAHESAVLRGDHTGIIRAAGHLRRAMADDRDAIETVAQALGAEIEMTAVTTATAIPSDGEEDETDPAEAARRVAAQWHNGVRRSSAGRAFSERVRIAYRDRCAVSGARLPRLPSTGSPGVEGAHILPWSRYDLNSLRNGICLDKLCHWAFDAGVMRIDYQDDAYVVSIPNQVNIDAGPNGMDLSYFESFVGPIPVDRFPPNPAHHPSPAYLREFNALMYSRA